MQVGTLIGHPAHTDGERRAGRQSPPPHRLYQRQTATDIVIAAINNSGNIGQFAIDAVRHR